MQGASPDDDKPDPSGRLLETKGGANAGMRGRGNVEKEKGGKQNHPNRQVLFFIFL